VQLVSEPLTTRDAWLRVSVAEERLHVSPGFSWGRSNLFETRYGASRRNLAKRTLPSRQQNDSTDTKE